MTGSGPQHPPELSSQRVGRRHHRIQLAGLSTRGQPKEHGNLMASERGPNGAIDLRRA